MYRTSTIIRNARLDKELSFEEVSKKTKIPIKYLEAIELEAISSFPEEPYCSLLVKDYAEFLGLDGQRMLGLFRRDFDQKRKVKSTRNQRFAFTPQFTFRLLIVLSIFAFSGYLIFEYIKFNRPPSLKVIWPETSYLSSKSVEIRGDTDPDSTVKINENLVIVDSDGKFQGKINISTSASKIVVVSKSPNGKTTVVEKTIKLQQ
jgi:cytoskeletal protein RodZ